MKKQILFILLVVSTLSCMNGQSKKEYFKDKISGKISTKSQYNEVKDKLLKKMSTLSDDVSVYGIFTDSIITTDSLIKVYQLHVDIGTPKNIEKKEAEKIFSFLNKKLPSKTMKTIDGRLIDLSNINKPTVLNFWFTTCKPCIDEMPVLNKIRNKYQDKVDFIAITDEPKDKTNSFFKKHKFEYQHIINEKEFIEQIGIQAFPKNIFIDKNGIVKFIEDGIPYLAKDGVIKPGDGKAFEEHIEKIL